MAASGPGMPVVIGWSWGTRPGSMPGTKPTTAAAPARASPEWMGADQGRLKLGTRLLPYSGRASDGT